MKKGTKIALGVGSALAAGMTAAGVLYVKNKKKNVKEEKDVTEKNIEKKTK